MVYALENGQKVRVRTCNDHILVVVADSPKPDARLNIEGTDYLLIVMPEKPRTRGAVIGYLVPTTVAVEAARRAHSEWLATSPATSGNNRTWNLWFDHLPTPHGDFATKWQQYRLGARASTTVAGTEEARVTTRKRPAEAPQSQRGLSLGEVIAESRKRIAEAAGVPIDAVKISVNLVV